MTIATAQDQLENGNLILPQSWLSVKTVTSRSPISSYPVTKRGSMGVITLKTNKRNGYLASFMLVRDDDDLIIITPGVG